MVPISEFECSSVDACSPFLISVYGLSCNPEVKSPPTTFKYELKPNVSGVYVVTLIGDQSVCELFGEVGPFTLELELSKPKDGVEVKQ
jgi:hypothetical protein